MNFQNKLIVLTGCSGGGKSILLAELNLKGYGTVSEVGRELVKEQLAVKGIITPWENPQAFCELLIEKSIAAYHQAKKLTGATNQMIFFDRSFLEGVSAWQTLKIKDSNKYDHFVDELRYYPSLFMAPPWQEIFSRDEERKHSFEDAVKEYERLVGFYAQAGYQLITLPKISIKERVEFVITSLS